jgi:glycosyltransferase involved in cell wall biosynthesis
VNGADRSSNTKPVLLIPAFGPPATLTAQVRELAPAWSRVIIVDDGSGPAFAPTFAALLDLPGVTVLKHAVNLGKGAALKTGLNHAACEFPDAPGIVTADADGQHLAGDILAVGAALVANPAVLVIGARSFNGRAVPFRSRFGNTISRFVMRAVTGQNLIDTQTGLRAIPMDFVADLLRTKPTGYDFELDMLVQCKFSGRRILSVPIETVYLDQNRSSHFDPLLDSMRIYFVLLRFASSSLLTSVIDNVVFSMLLSLTPNLMVCMIGARAVACSFNYAASKKGVFHSRIQNTVALPRFWFSAMAAGTLSYALMHALVTYAHAPVVPTKIAVETFLFGFSFVIQRDFVFTQRGSLTTA